MIEYYGPAIAALSMEGRMTICNMSIEAGARAGLIAPDDVTIEYITRGDRPFAPRARRSTRPSPTGRRSAPTIRAAFDRHVTIDAGALVPQVTWGTNPAMTVDVTGVVPDPEEVPFASPEDARRALDYMGLEPGTPISEIPVDVVFIGSCTNGRIEDLRAAARVFQGRKTAPGVQALVVPGSEAVRHQAEAEGLDRIFLEAGAEWRQAGCSMCLAMNPDKLKPGQRSASTSNRNFEGRQGPGRPHPPGQPGHGRRRRRHRPLHRRPPDCFSSERHLTAGIESIMEPFVTHRGRLAVLDWSDVNTDLIIPARYLKKIERTGFGPLLFADKRYAPGGAPRPTIPSSTGRSSPIFPLNDPAFEGATVLVVGHNFGCGSSREHAVWAVMQAGYRAVIAPGKGRGFADIFESNALPERPAGHRARRRRLADDRRRPARRAPGPGRGHDRPPRPDGQAPPHPDAARPSRTTPVPLRDPRIPSPPAAPRPRRDRRDPRPRPGIARHEHISPPGSIRNGIAVSMM